MPNGNFLEQELHQVGIAATQDLLSEDPVPRHLLHFVNSPSRFTAWSALQLASDLDTWECFIRKLYLKPILLRAAQHPDWWIRYAVAGQLEFRKPPKRLYIRLLSDPVLVVVREFLPILIEMPTEFVVDLYRSIPKLHRDRALLLLRSLQHDPYYVYFPEKQERAQNLYRRLLDYFGEPTANLSELDSLPEDLDVEDLARMPAELAILWLQRRRFDPDSFPLEAILSSCPDPAVRITAIEEYWGDRLPESALLQAIHDEHIGVQFAVARVLDVNETNWETLGRAVLHLTRHSCLPIVQYAVRALRECFESMTPDPQLVSRLLELLEHEDALVRVNTLHTLQHYWHAPQAIRQHLLQRWESEAVSRVKVAIAETLWWWMERDEWCQSFGKWLFEFEDGRWRRLWRHLKRF